MAVNGCVRLLHTMMSVWLQAEEDLGRRQQDPTWSPAQVAGCRVTSRVRGRQIVEGVKRGEDPATRLTVRHTRTHTHTAHATAHRCGC